MQPSSTPAPIFNYRKRPRQAVIANPFSGSPGPSGAAAQANTGCSDLMPVGGFPGRGQQRNNYEHRNMSGRGAATVTYNQTNGSQQTFTGNQHNRQPFNSNSTGRGSSIQGQGNFQNNSRGRSQVSTRGHRGSTSFTPSNRGGLAQSYPGRGRANMASNLNRNNPSLFNNQRPVCQQTHIDQYYGSGQGVDRGQDNNRNTGQKFSVGNNNNGGPNNKGYNFTRNATPVNKPHNTGGMQQRTATCTASYGQQSVQGMGQNSQNQGRGYSNQAGTGNAVGKGTFGQMQDGRYAQPSAGPSTSGNNNKQFADTDDQWDDSFEVNTQQMNQAMKNTIVVKNNKSHTKDIQHGLRFITVDIAGIRRWNKFKDHVQLLFEVFGVLDSAISRSHDGCKEFLLRDEKHQSLNCVFYEIDRQFPRATRGQWYRLVGTYDSTRERLMCLCIRPVQEGERRTAHICAQKSADVMTNLTRNLRES